MSQGRRIARVQRTARNRTTLPGSKLAESSAAQACRFRDWSDRKFPARHLCSLQAQTSYRPRRGSGFGFSVSRILTSSPPCPSRQRRLGARELRQPREMRPRRQRAIFGQRTNCDVRLKAAAEPIRTDARSNMGTASAYRLRKRDRLQVGLDAQPFSLSPPMRFRESRLSGW